MSQPIYINVQAQSPTAALVNSAGGQSQFWDMVFGDTRPLIITAYDATNNLSAEYTPSNWDLNFNVGTPGGAVLITATSTTGSGTTWTVSPIFNATALGTALAGKESIESTVEVQFKSRADSSIRFTPLQMKFTIRNKVSV